MSRHSPRTPLYAYVSLATPQHRPATLRNGPGTATHHASARRRVAGPVRAIALPIRRTTQYTPVMTQASAKYAARPSSHPQSAKTIAPRNRTEFPWRCRRPAGPARTNRRRNGYLPYFALTVSLGTKVSARFGQLSLRPPSHQRQTGQKGAVVRVVRPTFLQQDIHFQRHPGGPAVTGNGRPRVYVNRNNVWRGWRTAKPPSRFGERSRTARFGPVQRTPIHFSWTRPRRLAAAVALRAPCHHARPMPGREGTMITARAAKLEYGPRPSPSTRDRSWCTLNGVWQFTPQHGTRTSAATHWALSRMMEHHEPPVEYRRTFTAIPGRLSGRRAAPLSTRWITKRKSSLNGRSIGAHRSGCAPFSPFDIAPPEGQQRPELVVRVSDPQEPGGPLRAASRPPSRAASCTRPPPASGRPYSRHMQPPQLPPT